MFSANLVQTTALLFVSSPPACGSATCMQRTALQHKVRGVGHTPTQVKKPDTQYVLQAADIWPSHCWAATIPQCWRTYHPSHSRWCSSWTEMYVRKTTMLIRRVSQGSFAIRLTEMSQDQPLGVLHISRLYIPNHLKAHSSTVDNNILCCPCHSFFSHTLEPTTARLSKRCVHFYICLWAFAWLWQVFVRRIPPSPLKVWELGSTYVALHARMYEWLIE